MQAIGHVFIANNDWDYNYETRSSILINLYRTLIHLPEKNAVIWFCRVCSSYNLSLNISKMIRKPRTFPVSSFFYTLSSRTDYQMTLYLVIFIINSFYFRFSLSLFFCFLLLYISLWTIYKLKNRADNKQSLWSCHNLIISLIECCLRHMSSSSSYKSSPFWKSMMEFRGMKFFLIKRWWRNIKFVWDHLW
jgi:hypothetical protein